METKKRTGLIFSWTHTRMSHISSHEAPVHLCKSRLYCGVLQLFILSLCTGLILISITRDRSKDVRVDKLLLYCSTRLGSTQPILLHGGLW